MRDQAVIDGLNRVELIGHLGRAPEMRYTPSGKPVTSFSVVTIQDWVASNHELRRETDWFNIVAWGPLAEECKERLQKGQRVYVEGRLRTRRWKDGNDVLHSWAEIAAQNVLPFDCEGP
jgi:single-strand DNA-binding protein